MRPVDRGPWPLDDENRTKSLHPYQRAKADLLDRLGNYCSYCERTGDLHVEHVISRKRCLELEEEWTNLLLGCANCNGTKRDRNPSRDGYLWPDQDDTQAAFEYLPEGIVQVRTELSEATRVKAENLYELIGLGRRPTNDPQARDLRWRKRREAWGQAIYAKRQFEDGAEIGWVVRLAVAIGFWSIWMTVFSDHPEVRERLENSFPGTRRPAG